MSNLFALVTSRLALLLLCALPLAVNAASKKEASIDTSIIEQSESLRAYMTAPQRLIYIKALELIKEGESDIRSGETLLQQKQSILDPNKDLGPIHKRGEQLVQDGQAKVTQGQQQLVELLTLVQSQKTATQASAAQKYNFNLPEAPYQVALLEAAKAIMATCRNAGYTNIFVDGLQIITADKNYKAGIEINNATYDTLIQADGSHYSIKVPLGLKLVQDETSSKYTFQYDNSEVFKGDKSALLGIELIYPSSEPDALLSIRAFDFDTQQLISSSLFYIADASAMLHTNTDSAMGAKTSETSTTVSPTTRTIPSSVTIHDPQQLIDTIGKIPTPYLFDSIQSTDNPAQSVVVDSLLKDTLLKNSDLILVEAAYIRRTYLPTEVEPETFSSNATATLSIIQTDDDYLIGAKAHDSGRIIEIGTMTLNFPE